MGGSKSIFRQKFHSHPVHFKWNDIAFNKLMFFKLTNE